MSTHQPSQARSEGADMPTIAILTNTEHNTDPWANRHSAQREYIQAIILAGGRPMLVPCIPREEIVIPLLEMADGVLITGGADVSPLEYGQQPHPRLRYVNPDRDGLDRIAVRWLLDHPEVPCLAICRGIQAYNAYAGGTLIQDIAAQVRGAIKHSQDAPPWAVSHSITVDPGCLLASIWSSGEVLVNSFHHQAVDQPAEGLKVVARSPDGVIEAMERPDARWTLLVQCHPEQMVYHHAHARALFEAFVAACRE